MLNVKRLSRNTVGRDLIVGDVHGCFTKLRAALDSVAFDERKDRVISVGDLVDRGPESDQSLEWLGKPWFHAVKGNHEDMAICWPRGGMYAGHYLQNGGAWNLANPPGVQIEFADAFDALPVAIEIETDGGLVGVVHADVPGADWERFVELLAAGGGAARDAIDHAQWSRSRIDAHLTGFPTVPVSGVRAVVVGHTPVQGVVVAGNVYHIDTGGWLRGREFTVLDAATLLAAERVVN